MSLRKKRLAFQGRKLLSQRMWQYPPTLPILEPFNHGTASHWTPSWLLHVQPTSSSSCQGLTVTTWTYIQLERKPFSCPSILPLHVFLKLCRNVPNAHTRKKESERVCLSWIPDVLFKNPRSAKVHMYQQIKKDSWLSAGWKTKTNPQGWYTNLIWNENPAIVTRTYLNAL